MGWPGRFWPGPEDPRPQPGGGVGCGRVVCREIAATEPAHPDSDNRDCGADRGRTGGGKPPAAATRIEGLRGGRSGRREACAGCRWGPVRVRRRRRPVWSPLEPARMGRRGVGGPVRRLGPQPDPEVQGGFRVRRRRSVVTPGSRQGDAAT